MEDFKIEYDKGTDTNGYKMYFEYKEKIIKGFIAPQTVRDHFNDNGKRINKEEDINALKKHKPMFYDILLKKVEDERNIELIKHDGVADKKIIIYPEDFGNKDFRNK
jgi:hypothetical protein